MNVFKVAGLLSIGTLKTNRIIYPVNVRMSICDFASYLRTKSPSVRLVTVNRCPYYVYHYEGKLNNGMECAVLITYPKRTIRDPKALCAFLCLDYGKSTKNILDAYLMSWDIKVFFRQCKEKQAFDQCQIRSSKGICRYRK